MCGIVGVAGRQDALTPVAMDHALGALRHRGPDANGTVRIDEIGGIFGHTRLSILDLSPLGAQPMTSRSGRWTVTYNGELYGFGRLRSDLTSAGRPPSGESDTAVLVEALDLWGLDGTLRRIDGMFAFAAADRTTGVVHLVRDRFGEKPLYWRHDGSGLAFASELGGLRAVVDTPLEVDPSSLASVLRWSFIPHPHTAYREVWQLPPGHRLAFNSRSGAAPEVVAWWDLRQATIDHAGEADALTLDEAAEQLGILLTRSVADRLQSDVPLGVFLSGGIDSSLVAAAARQALDGATLRTFTVSMAGAEVDEAPFAASVAAHLGSTHEVLMLDPRAALEMAPRIAQHWDEPFADPSMLPTYLICQAAAEQVTVCLGGDGGDELFAGYNRHVVGARLATAAKRLPAPLRQLAGSTLLHTPPGLVRFGQRLTPGAPVPELELKLQKAGLLLRGDEDTWAGLVGIWPDSSLEVSPHAPAIPDWVSDLPLVEQLVLADTAVVLPDQMLLKVDRGAMASSLEVRSPFLNPDILSWAWSLPMSHKADGNTGKVVMRRLAEQWLPPSISSRKKMGFDPPLAGWLRGELRDWATSLLDDARVVELGVLDRSDLHQTWAEHQSGKRNWDYRLWGVLMVESWLAQRP